MRDAVGLGERGEPDQEERRETVTVVGIGNLEGDLGLVLVGADGECVSDDGLVVVGERDESHCLRPGRA